MFERVIVTLVELVHLGVTALMIETWSEPARAEGRPLTTSLYVVVSFFVGLSFLPTLKEKKQSHWLALVGLFGFLGESIVRILPDRKSFVQSRGFEVLVKGRDIQVHDSRSH